MCPRTTGGFPESFTFLPSCSECGASRGPSPTDSDLSRVRLLRDETACPVLIAYGLRRFALPDVFLCDTLAWRGVCDIPGGYGLNDLALHTYGRVASVGLALRFRPVENFRRSADAVVDALAGLAPLSGPVCDSPPFAIVFALPHGMKAYVRSSRPLRSLGTIPAGGSVT